jgi:hypothetical protein
MSAPMNRRAAFGAIVGAGAALASPVAAIALVDASPALAKLIAAHGEARAAFEIAIDELEAAEPEETDRVVGIAGCDYSLKNGEDNIAERIDEHFERLSEAARAIGMISPAVGAEALAALERDRDAAMDRLSDAFAAVNAAHERWHQKCNAEEAALEAVCAHRCGSTDEYTTKFRYLLKYRSDFSEEQYEAIFASLLPEGDLDEV